MSLCVAAKKIVGNVSFAIFNWQAKYGGMEVSSMKRLNILEAENSKLKKLLAEQIMDNATLKEVLSRKW